VIVGSTDIVTIVVRDAFGNAVSGLASNAFHFTLSGGTSAGVFGVVTETSTPGTYTVTFTGTTAGSASTLTATVNGATILAGPTVTVTAPTHRRHRRRHHHRHHPQPPKMQGKPPQADGNLGK
jgi:hypothetical protein